MPDNNIIITGGRSFGRSLLHEAIKNGLISAVEPNAQLTYADLKDLKEKIYELPVRNKITAEENEKKIFELYEGTKLEFKPYQFEEMDVETRIIRSSFGFKKSRKCNNSQRPKPRKKKRK